MNAIEMTGTVGADHELHLDEPLLIAGPSRVRVIILVPEAGEAISENASTRAAAFNPAFDFLKETGEDIYKASDGKPFHDQG